MSIEDDKKEIDEMSQEEMCRLWRFAPTGYRLFIGELGFYFEKKLREKGGFTPEISRKLDWER
jgi:hypothetical protein